MSTQPRGSSSSTDSNAKQAGPTMPPPRGPPPQSHRPPMMHPPMPPGPLGHPGMPPPPFMGPPPGPFAHPPPGHMPPPHMHPTATIGAPPMAAGQAAAAAPTTAAGAPTASGHVPAPGSNMAVGTASSSATGTSEQDEQQQQKKKKHKPNRACGDQKWYDQTLDEWDPNDFRIFVGDLGNEVNDDTLARAFQQYPSFTKAKVVRDVKNKKSRGYGFVSFKDGKDFLRALKEMNGKYIGNRPCKLRRSVWKDRDRKVQAKKKAALTGELPAKKAKK